MESFLKPHFHILAEPTFGRAKKIRVWMNGDSSHKCFDINLNPNVLRTWNTVLKYLTLTIHPPFGVIRKLICLSSKKAVTCFEELSANEKYIALGINSKLIIMEQGYKSSSEHELLKKKKTRRQFYSGDMNSMNFQFLQDTKRRNLTVIHMVANGQVCQSPTKVVLNENDLSHWNFSLEFISKMLDIPEGIQHICTIFGDIVRDPFELQHGFLYVALPFNEKFEKIDYTSTFGRASNKSCYVLKIRQNNGPSRVCCPIKEKSKGHQKANCSRMKCLKKSDDERDCRVLLPQEISESCRTIEIEDEKKEGIVDIKNCCSAHDERNLWCRLRRYNPGCCGIQKSVPPDQLNNIITSKSEEKYLQNNDTKTEKILNGENSIPYERESSPEKLCDDLNKSDTPEDPMQAEDKLSMDSIEQSSIKIDSAALVESTPPQNDDKILTYFSRGDNGDSVSIDRCSNTEKSMLKEEKPNISEYSQCSESYKQDLQNMENRVSRGISAVFSDINVYPDHQPKKRPSIYIRNRTDINVVGYSKHDRRHRSDDEKKSYDSSSPSESSSTTPVNGNLERCDHGCCFCREAGKPNVSTKQVSKSKKNGIGEEKQKDSTKIFMETRGEHSTFDKTFNENDKTPTNIVPTKISDDLKKKKSQGNKIVEEGVNITIDNIEKSHGDKDNISTKSDSERPPSLRTILDSILSSDSKETQQRSPRKKNSSRNSAASAVQKIMKIIEDSLPFADLEQAEIMDKKVSLEQEHSSERKGMLLDHSVRSQDLGTVRDDNIPSLDSKEAQQSSPRRKSSVRNSAASAVQKIMKIIEDNIPFADLEQAEIMKEKVSSDQDQEHSSQNKIILRDHSERSQSLGTVPDDNIPSLDSKEDQQRSPRRKSSSSRNSAASAVQKMMKIIEDSIPFADLEQAEIMDKNVSLEQEQEHSSEKKNSGPESLGTIPDDNIPSLDSEEAQQSPPRKSSLRSSAASAVRKVLKIIEDNIPFEDLEQAEVVEKKVSSAQDQETNFLLDHPKAQNLASSLGQNDSPSISEEGQEITSMKGSSQMSSGSRECPKGKCKLRNVKRIIEEVCSGSECKQAQQSVSKEKDVKRYSDAIMNVKKIMEGSTAKISEVLSKVKEDPDKKNMPSTRQDSSNFSDSSGEENTKAYLP